MGLTSDDIYCYILNYIKYVKCFKSLISTLQTHQQNLCVKQTASKIRTKFIINNNVYVNKIIEVILSLNIRRTRTKRIRSYNNIQLSSTMSNEIPRSFVKRCSFTQDLANLLSGDKKIIIFHFLTIDPTSSYYCHKK